MKISFVIPVYNLEKYIGTLLNSLGAQSDKQFEVIIIDDGSTDNTYIKIIQHIQRLKVDCYVESTCNAGVSAARNLGLSKAQGTYVCFIDGDDFLADDCVATIHKHCRDRRTDIVCWGFDEINEDLSVHRRYLQYFQGDMQCLTGNEALEQIIVHKSLRIWSGSAAYKREFLLREKLAFHEGCSNGEDQEFIYKSLSKAAAVLFINRTLSFYLQRPDSISNRYDVQRFDVVDALDRAYSQIAKVGSTAALEYAFQTVYIGNYMHNLDSCIENSRMRYIKHILQDIDAAYPGLNKKMRKAMRTYKGEDQAIKRRSLLFLLSPFLYVFYRNMENRREYQ